MAFVDSVCLKRRSVLRVLRECIGHLPTLFNTEFIEALRSYARPREAVLQRRLLATYYRTIQAVA